MKKTLLLTLRQMKSFDSNDILKPCSMTTKYVFADMELASRADKIYKDVCSGKVGTISQEELEKKYGLK